MAKLDPTDDAASTRTAPDAPIAGVGAGDGTEARDADAQGDGPRKKLKKKVYERELARLQLELVKMEDWVKAKGLDLLCSSRGGTPRARAG